MLQPLVRLYAILVVQHYVPTAKMELLRKNRNDIGVLNYFILHAYFTRNAFIGCYVTTFTVFIVHFQKSKYLFSNINNKPLNFSCRAITE